MNLKLLAFSSLLYLTCNSQKLQSDSFVSPPKLVNTKWVTDWGRTIYLFPDKYWGNKSDEIVRQVGIDEFNKIIKFSHRDNIPCEMQIFCEDKNGIPKKNSDSLAAKQSRLKVYKIATYKHNDKEYAILRVPYSGNESWDISARWDTVYFVIQNRFLKDVTMDFVQLAPPSIMPLYSVKINSWDNLLLGLPANYWHSSDRVNEEIVHQLGLKKFSTINAFLKRKSYPAKMLKENSESYDSYSKRMNKLKIYRIATYAGTDEQGKNTGEFSVLCIPYEENKAWDFSAKWDTVYFVLPSNNVINLK